MKQSMRKDLLLIVLLTTGVMLLAVLAVVKYSISMAIAFSGVITAFAIFAAALVWRSRPAVSNYRAIPEANWPLLKIIWPFVIGAIGVLFMALREGWNIGDTIGAIFFSVLVLLASHEMVRRRRSSNSR
jgi:hypothetical protein